MAASNVALVEDRPSWAAKLSDREFVWVSRYIIHFNGTRAAIESGSPPGSAYARAHDIKHRPHVRAAIQAAMKEAMPAIKMTIAERLAAIVTTDIGQIVEWGEGRVNLNAGQVDSKGRRKKAHYAETTVMRVRDVKKLDDTQRAAIKSIKRRVSIHGSSIDVVMHDPVIAAERLQHLLELTKENPNATGGTVTFVIEAPDGSVMTLAPAGGKVIEGEVVDAAIKADRAESGPEDAPPGSRSRGRGGKLTIETP